jgi:hypothetical protein
MTRGDLLAAGRLGSTRPKYDTSQEKKPRNEIKKRDARAATTSAARAARVRRCRSRPLRGRPCSPPGSWSPPEGDQKNDRMKPWQAAVTRRRGTPRGDFASFLTIRSPIMNTRLSWCTTTISASARQRIHIKPTTPLAGDDTVLLDETPSDLLSRILNELAQNADIPWTIARQAVLRAFYLDEQESINQATGFHPGTTDRPQRGLI